MPPSVVDVSTLASSSSLVGYWALDGDGIDFGPNGLDGVLVAAEFVDGMWGEAFYFNGDDTVHIVDNGASPLDVDSVLMLAWIMPTHYATVADRGIIMNKYVP